MVERRTEISRKSLLRPLPAAVFLASAAFAVVWWFDLASSRDRVVDERLRAEALQATVKVAERLEAYDTLLRGAAGLFASSEDVTRSEFRRYVSALELGRTYQGVQGVGWSRWIASADLAAHERTVRAGGFPDYAVHPSGPRDAYTSIVYLEPFSGRNLRAFGFDMWSEPVRRAAMERSRDTGEAATSGRVTLVQETETDVQPGYLTYLPVFDPGPAPRTLEERRARLRGWVYSPLRAYDLMRGILAEDLRGIRLRIYDGTEPGPEHLLYDGNRGEPVVAQRTFTTTLPVNGRDWSLVFTAPPGYGAALGYRSTAWDGLWMAVVVLLLTGLTVGFVRSAEGRRREAGLARSLRESEARYRNTFERAPVGIFVVDADDRFLQVNPRYCELTGWSEEELLRMRWHEVIHPEDRELDAGIVRALRAGERPSGTLVRRGMRKDGTVFWGETSLSLETGRPDPRAPLVGVVADVTGRHEAEAKFREIAERSHAGIAIDQDGEIVYANQAAAEIAGLPPRDLLGPAHRIVDALVHPEDRALIEADQAAGSRGPGHQAPSLRFRLVRPDGSVRHVERLARPIQHRSRPAVLLTFFDVTERERTEEELRKTQRLESLGLLAGGIAHDFNNLLTAVFGQIEQAHARLAPGAAARRELDEALAALARARDLTRQLLTFSAGGAPERRLLDVRTVLEAAAKMGLGGSSVRAVFDVAEGLPAVEADEGQMSQLFSNLLLNARQATDGPGEVTLRARARRVEAGEIPGLPEGAYVEIVVRDAGHGIPEDVLPKVFDPFFTTRATGTGLGLATSYSIVTRHGGHLSIASRVGEGTAVTVLLPAAEGAVGRPEREAAAEIPARLRVLVMDDEPLVLRVGVKHLRKLGAEVESVTKGEEAVEAYRRALAAGARPDVVILDLTVTGGMGGAETVRRLREIDPGVVAVACSGYFEDAVMAEPGRFGFADVLPKPYLGDDLRRVLARVTAGARGEAPGAAGE